MASARRLSALVASALLTAFCVQLLWSHQKLAGLDYLDEYAVADQRSQERGRLASHSKVNWVTRKQQAHAGSRQQAGGSWRPNPAIILFCYNRVGYLNQTLHSLANLTGLSQYTVYVSQDGDDPGVRELVTQLSTTLFGQGSKARGFVHWMRPRVPELGEKQPGTAWLAQHYRWGLERVFMEQGHSHVIIVEDDMLFSPDFLEYFDAIAPLLDADPSLWCISSWNDNGFTTMHDWDVSSLFRTSYFPGLGWMMKRDLWLELGQKWPKDHWDHWMRTEDVSRGRECVAPEVNRNRNIGEVGANMNKSSFRRYLAAMGWSTEEHVDLGDLSYLLRPAYTAAMQRAVAGATPWEIKWGGKSLAELQPRKTYLVTYRIEEYQKLATRLKLWSYPRGHHQYVASIPFRGARLLLADRRFCPLLPPGLQLHPTPGMRIVASERNQSCTASCAAHGGLTCRAGDFWYINNCTALKRHFPCERGCTVELGIDVPNYVMDPNSPGHLYCLITQRPSTCRAINPGVARLCPCSPPASSGGGTEAEEKEEEGKGALGGDRAGLIHEMLAANRQKAALNPFKVGSIGSADSSSSSSSGGAARSIQLGGIGDGSIGSGGDGDSSSGGGGSGGSSDGSGSAAQSIEAGDSGGGEQGSLPRPPRLVTNSSSSSGSSSSGSNDASHELAIDGSLSSTGDRGTSDDSSTIHIGAVAGSEGALAIGSTLQEDSTEGSTRGEEM